MVAHFTIHTYGVNQAFQFFEGIWLHRKSHQIRFFFSLKLPNLHNTCAPCSELTSNTSIMGQPVYHPHNNPIENGQGGEIFGLKTQKKKRLKSPKEKKKGKKKKKKKKE